MRFGEAGLLGNGMIGETRTEFFKRDAEGNCSGCYIGGAIFAIGKADLYGTIGFIELVHREWPWTRTLVACLDSEHQDPIWACYDNPMSVANIASHLHCSGWSRPRIAAWIESIDPTRLPAGVEQDVAP